MTGVSPTAKVVKAGTSNTATITITDASGTTTAQVADGAKVIKGIRVIPVQQVQLGLKEPMVFIKALRNTR